MGGSRPKADMPILRYGRRLTLGIVGDLKDSGAGGIKQRSDFDTIFRAVDPGRGKNGGRFKRSVGCRTPH
jgi:hypothetical protein